MHGSKINIKFNEEYCLLKSGSCSTCLVRFRRTLTLDASYRTVRVHLKVVMNCFWPQILETRTSWLKTTLCPLQVLLHAGVTLFRDLTRDTLAMRTGTHVGHTYRNCYWWITLTNSECIDKFYQDSSLTDFVKIHLWFFCLYVYTDKRTDWQTNTLQRIVNILLPLCCKRSEKAYIKY